MEGLGRDQQLGPLPGRQVGPDDGDVTGAVLVEPQEEDPAAAMRTALAVEAELAAGGVDVALVVHGQGAAAWPVLRFALERGHDLRIGLEDTLAGPDGSPARDNEQLVAEARRMIEAYRSSG